MTTLTQENKTSLSIYLDSDDLENLIADYIQEHPDKFKVPPELRSSEATYEVQVHEYSISITIEIVDRKETEL